jgi:flagellar hook protein FlgE
MVPSLNTGISGLKANQTQIDVVGNNISNVNTISYKRSRANFNEVLGQRMMGTSRIAGGEPAHRSTMGRGVNVGSIDKDWGQGRLDTTNVSTDLALSNDGFFIARSGENRMLTRAGNFAFNSEGELVTSGGLPVQGYSVDEQGNVDTTGVQDIQLDMERTAPPKATETLSFGGNLSSEAAVADTIDVEGQLRDDGTGGDQTIDLGQFHGEQLELRFSHTGTNDEWDVEYQLGGGGGFTTIGSGPVEIGSDTSITLPAGTLTNSGKATTIDISDVSSTTGTSAIAGHIHDSTAQSVTVYDEKGESHTLNLELARINATETGGTDDWSFRLVDPAGNTLNNGSGTLSMNTDGTLNTINGNPVDTNGYDVDFDWDINGNGTTESLTLNFGNETNSMTQYSGSTTAAFKSQDGYASGALESYDFTSAGNLQLSYTNGNTEDIFQLALGRVDNQDGLKQEGENMYSATFQSGSLRLGRAGREFNTSVVSGALEQSNVDLATEFSEMIKSQRGYQASARVITTSDEVLQETVSLKR